MKDFLGNQLAIGDIVSTVVFRSPGKRLGWRMNLARIIEINDHEDQFAATCKARVLDPTAIEVIEATIDAVLLYSNEYRNANLNYLLDLFKDWSPQP